ncbi:hypothetical protein GCM10007209_00680 [Haloferax sulfurifontis]|uniref:Uncharacterized protein n=1 Tax=Haloferax sulfurifontis TaxID=255616 RepID=A0A830DKT9_9EURY|nr:hypothetical protein GCM10007209_00680 [Haloferax sulfurifontis]
MTKPNPSGDVKGVDDGTHRKVRRNGIDTNTESFVTGRRGQSAEEEPKQPRNRSASEWQEDQVPDHEESEFGNSAQAENGREGCGKRLPSGF